jgi:hypothetical protein
MEPQCLRLSLAPMMMINQGAWIVGTRPTLSQHPRHDVNLFAHEESTRTKSLIESIDRLKGRPTAGKISAVNQSSRQKISGTKVLSGGFFLDCDPVILRIVEQNSPTYEAKSRVFFEAAYNRIEEVIGRITVVVRESNYVPLRHRPSPIVRPSKPRLRLNDGF